MKVTPLDLRQTHFRKGMRGYDPEEVRGLLADAADDYEAALRDLDHLRQELQKAEVQLGEYREREANLRNTLLTAQKVADQIRENAAKEADVLMRDAESRAAAALKDADTRSAALTADAEARLRDAETQSAALLREADLKASSVVRDAEATAANTLQQAETRAAGYVQDAELRADATIKDATLRADALVAEASMRSDAMVKEAQARVDLLMQKAHARLDELDHAVAEMRLRKRDVEGTLEQSIASLTYALEFVRTQDQRDDKVRLHRPRLNEPAATAEPRLHQDAEARLG